MRSTGTRVGRRLDIIPTFPLQVPAWRLNHVRFLEPSLRESTCNRWLCGGRVHRWYLGGCHEAWDIDSKSSWQLIDVGVVHARVLEAKEIAPWEGPDVLLWWAYQSLLKPTSFQRKVLMGIIVFLMNITCQCQWSYFNMKRSCLFTRDVKSEEWTNLFLCW